MAGIVWTLPEVVLWNILKKHRLCPRLGKVFSPLGRGRCQESSPLRPRSSQAASLMHTAVVFVDLQKPDVNQRGAGPEPCSPFSRHSAGHVVGAW